MRTSRTVPDANTQFNFAVLKQVLPYITKYKYRIAIAFICLALAKVASVYLPFILKDIVNYLDVASDETQKLILAPFALIVAYGLVRFANVIFSELRDLLFGRVTETAMREISLKVFSHIHQLDLEFHLSRKTGAVARDIERGISGISFVMRFFIFNIGPTILELSFVIAILLKNYGLHYAIVIVVAVVTYVVFSVKVTNWRLKYIKQANVADNESNTQAVDSLLNFETVKYFNNEQHEADNYDVALANWQSARRSNRLSLFVLNGGQALIIASAMCAMLAFAAIDVSAGHITIGDFVLINAFMMQIFIPLNFLGFVYREIKGSLTNIENMFALLSEQAKVIEPINAEALQLKKGKIEFKNASFCYQAERQIINNLSFVIEAGKKVAIVGPSGSGKSTLTKLLYRFYDLDSGEILIDGQAINTKSLSSVRQAIAIVPQDTILFNNSIKNNIQYGRLTATEDEVFKALEAAQLSDFVLSLPKQLETQVGERGLKLSGGEKQRVAIARSLLKPSKILIFDEATSSLDSHNEAQIMKTIQQVSSGYTSIVIAHRLSTIIDADEILYMQAGQIQERGTHQELLASDGLYAKLWYAQSTQDINTD